MKSVRVRKNVVHEGNMRNRSLEIMLLHRHLVEFEANYVSASGWAPVAKAMTSDHALFEKN